MRLGLEIGSIASIVTIACWIGVYSYLERWWTGHVGQSLVEFALYAMVTPALFILSLFWHLSRSTNHVLGWVEVVLLCVLIPFGMVRRIRTWWIGAKSGDKGRLPAGKKDE